MQMAFVNLIRYNLVWGPKVIPGDIKELLDNPLHPWKYHFNSPWVYSEDGPELELSTPLAVTWENLKSDLYGLLELGAIGEALIVDLNSSNLVVKIVLGGTIIVATALTVEEACAMANKPIHFPI